MACHRHNECVDVSCTPAGGELSGVDWDRLFTTLLGDQAKEEQLQPTDDQGGWVGGYRGDLLLPANRCLLLSLLVTQHRACCQPSAQLLHLSAVACTCLYQQMLSMRPLQASTCKQAEC
jgi:hypothetical protein